MADPLNKNDPAGVALVRKLKRINPIVLSISCLGGFVPSIKH